MKRGKSQSWLSGSRLVKYFFFSVKIGNTHVYLGRAETQLVDLSVAVSLGLFANVRRSSVFVITITN